MALQPPCHIGAFMASPMFPVITPPSRNLKLRRRRRRPAWTTPSPTPVSQTALQVASTNDGPRKPVPPGSPPPSSDSNSPRPPPPPSPSPPPPPVPKRVPLPPAQRAFGGGRGAGGEMSVEELQASVAELLGMQGFGSGSWKESGVPAAVEREQRTLVREIKAMGRKGRWGDVLDVVERARYQGTELNSIIYGCAIGAVGRCGRWREALSLLEFMRAENIEPDEYTYNAAIAACSGANQWERALGVFRTMQKRADGQGVGAHDRSGMSISETEILGVTEREGEFERRGGEARAGAGVRGAIARASSGKASAPGTTTYNAVIMACARGFRTEEALSLLREMSGRGVPPDEMTYNAAIDACAKGGQWRQGLELLFEMGEAGLRPSLVSYNTALGACARDGRWEEAADLIDFMRGDNGGLAPEDIDGYPQPSEEREAPPLADTTAFDLGLAGGRDRDQRLEGRAPRPGSDATANANASADGDGGGDGDGESWMPPLTRPPAPRPDTRSYNACIAACRRGGQRGLARLFFLELMSRGLRPDVATFKSMLLDRLDPAMVASERSAEQSVERSAPGGGSREHAEAAGRRRAPTSTDPLRWMQALSLLEAVDGEGLGPDPPCISLALSECAKAGRWKECRALLGDLREACPPGDPLYPRVSRYNSVLTALRNASRGRPSRTPTAAETRAQGTHADADTDTDIGDSKMGRRRGPPPAGRGGSSRDEGVVGAVAGGAMESGAEGWASGHVAALLGDMRAAGATPDNETYRCAVRCATDAAVVEAFAKDGGRGGEG